MDKLGCRHRERWAKYHGKGHRSYSEDTEESVLSKEQENVQALNIENGVFHSAPGCHQGPRR